MNEHEDYYRGRSAGQWWAETCSADMPVGFYGSATPYARGFRAGFREECAWQQQNASE